MTHSKQISKSTGASSNNHEKSFNENDRKQLYEINDIVKTLVEEIKMLKTQLERSNSKVKHLEIENAQLKQTANLTLYKLDSLEQYRCHVNLRIHNVPKNKKTIDNGKEIILKVAKCLNVNLQSTDIQRAHRLGKKDLTRRN